jgi:hypothetical protein
MYFVSCRNEGLYFKVLLNQQKIRGKARETEDMQLCVVCIKSSS